MNPINIRTVKGARHNGQVDFRYHRVQNRAAAVLDACEEFGEFLDIDIVAHLHRLDVNQIRKDLYGDPKEFKKLFGTTSIDKLEAVIERCMNEIRQGVHPALVSVAHRIPFMLMHGIENNEDKKQVITEFF